MLFLLCRICFLRFVLDICLSNMAGILAYVSCSGVWWARRLIFEFMYTYRLGRMNDCQVLKGELCILVPGVLIYGPGAFSLGDLLLVYAFYFLSRCFVLFFWTEWSNVCSWLFFLFLVRSGFNFWWVLFMAGCLLWIVRMCICWMSSSLDVVCHSTHTRERLWKMVICSVESRLRLMFLGVMHWQSGGSSGPRPVWACPFMKALLSRQFVFCKGCMGLFCWITIIEVCLLIESLLALRWFWLRRWSGHNYNKWFQLDEPQEMPERAQS